MADAHTTYRPTAANAVALHARTAGWIRGEGPEGVIAQPVGFDAIDPAGGVNASAADMANWMRIQLGQGAAPDGRRLWSEAAAKAMWSPNVVVPADAFTLPPALAGMAPDFQTYALGWFVESWRGHLVIEHSGAVFGALSMLYLVPDEHLGVYVSINSEDSATRRAVMFHLLDAYLGAPPTDRIGRLNAARQQSLAEARLALAAHRAPRIAPGVRPSLPLARYAGVYRDPWYGPMHIGLASSALSIRFDLTPGMEGAMTPLGGDRFVAHWRDRNIEDAFVDAHIKDGRVASITLSPVSPLADFSFDYRDLDFTPAKDQASGSAMVGN
jgi:hypothetical protein